MKNKIILFVIALILVTLQPAFGAFPIKHTAAINNALPVVSTTQPTNHFGAKRYRRATRIATIFRSPNELLTPERRRRDTEGILSLVFGLISLIPLYGLLFTLPAIILGAIGLGRHERYSVLGLIFGVLGIFVSLAVFVIILTAQI